MSYNLLAQRAGEAFAALLAPVYRTTLALGENDPVPVYVREFSEVRTQSMITCSGDTEAEYPRSTGNFYVTMAVVVQSPATKQPGAIAEPIDDHKALLSAVVNTLNVDDLEDQLTAAVADFHVFKGSIERNGEDQDTEPEGNILRDTVNYRFLACASDLT